MYKENEEISKDEEISKEISKRLIDCYIEWLEARAEKDKKGGNKNG